MSVQRYDIEGATGPGANYGDLNVRESEDGAWVLHSDHLAALAPRWSYEPPTEPGDYFMQFRGKVVLRVTVRRAADGTLYWKSDPMAGLVESVDVRWCPVPEPDPAAPWPDAPDEGGTLLSSQGVPGGDAEPPRR